MSHCTYAGLADESGFRFSFIARRALIAHRRADADLPVDATAGVVIVVGRVLAHRLDVMTFVG